MALIERLLGEEEPRIAGQVLLAAMSELARGELTKAQIVAGLELDSAAEGELDQLIAHTSAMSGDEKLKYGLMLHQVVVLAQTGAVYATPATMRARLSVT